MAFLQLEQLWKRVDHRKIRGARGQRFASLGFHFVFFISIAFLIEYVFRSTDIPITHTPPPPVKAPPPLERSVSYTITTEMPHMKLMEIETAAPATTPPRSGLDYKKLRETGKLG